MQRVFGRTGTDAVLVRVRDGARTDAIADRIRVAVGGAAIVGTAGDVVRPEQSSFAAIRQLLAMVGAAGLLTAGTVLFVCWRLLVEDERETIGRLRLAGAAPRAIVAGSAVIFAAVLLASAAVGIPIGLVAAGALTSFSRQVVSLTGLAAAPQPPAILLPAAVGLTAGLAISAVAWIAGLRSCLRVPAIEAVRGVSPRCAALGAGVPAARGRVSARSRGVRPHSHAAQPPAGWCAGRRGRGGDRRRRGAAAARRCRRPAPRPLRRPRRGP